MNKIIKVLQIIDSLNPGGAEMMAVNIANALQETGVDAHICATRVEGSLKSNIAEGVGYLFLNRKTTIDIKAIRKLYKYICQHNISIIHAHSSSFFIALLVKLIHPRIQLIWHNHYGNTKNITFKRKIPLLFASKFFNSVISVNKELNRWAIKNFKNNNCYYVPNFAILNNQNKETLLKGAQHKRIVCLANLREEKDHLNLLKAFQIVLKSHKDWTLHLVGTDLKDHYSNKIKSVICDNYLSNHVFLYDSCSDIKFILEQSTIGVLASNFEGLPVSLLEYGLTKLPVVVTNVGECGGIVENNRNGIVVSSENSIELANGMLFLINNNDKRKEFGELLFAKVSSNYSKENYMNQLISIYNID